MPEQVFGDVPALVLVMDAVRLGHLHPVHEGFAEGGVAADQQDRLGRHALAGHVEQHEADPALLGRLAGADEAEDPVRLVGIAGPYLLPIDDVMVARVLRARRQAGEIGPGVGLRITLAPPDLTARDWGQVIELLFLRAIFQQRGPEHRDAEAVERIARLDPRHLLAKHLRLRRRKPAAAIFGRPVGHGPAARAHPVHPRLLRRRQHRLVAPAPARVLLRPHRLAHLGRAILFQPSAGLGAEGVEVGHGGQLPVRWCAARATAMAVWS